MWSNIIPTQCWTIVLGTSPRARERRVLLINTNAEFCFGGKRETVDRPGGARGMLFLGGMYRGRRRRQTVSCWRSISWSVLSTKRPRARAKGASIPSFLAPLRPETGSVCRLPRRRPPSGSLSHCRPDQSLVNREPLDVDRTLISSLPSSDWERSHSS